MLTFTQIPDTNIIELTIDGGCTREEFDAVAAHIDGMIADFGEIKLIKVVRGIGLMEPSALWADLKWAPKQLKSISHVAVVADGKWIEWLTSVADRFMGAEMRSFDLDDLDNARAWLTSLPTLTSAAS